MYARCTQEPRPTEVTVLRGASSALPRAGRVYLAWHRPRWRRGGAGVGRGRTRPHIDRVAGCGQVKVGVGPLLLSLTRCFDSPLSVRLWSIHDQGRRDRERVQGSRVLQEGERRDRRDGVRHHQGHPREGREDQALRLRQLRRPREALARRPEPADRARDRDQRAPRADLPPVAGAEERAEFLERRVALRVRQFALTARGAGDTSPALAGASAATPAGETAVPGRSAAW